MVVGWVPLPVPVSREPPRGKKAKGADLSPMRQPCLGSASRDLLCPTMPAKGRL